MSVALPPGCLASALCRAGECKGCAPLFANRDGALARLALAPALRDAVAMAALRRLAVNHVGGAAHALLDDHEVLAVLAAAVIAGRLHLCQGQASADADPASASAAKVGVATKPADGAGGPPPPPPRPSSAAPPAPRPTPPPAPTAPPLDAAPEIDAAAQAATLRAAAQSGVPFCAECEKARAARAAHAAEPA